MKRVNQETLHFFNLPGLQGLQAVHGINVANEFRRLVHNRFCIGIVLKGTRVICCGNMSMTIPEDSLFVINPGESHACKSRHGRHSYFTVCIEAESMKASASQISGKGSAVPYFKNVLLCDKELVSEIRRFCLHCFPHLLCVTGMSRQFRVKQARMMVQLKGSANSSGCIIRKICY
jgi:hypothetical protein